MNIMRKKELLYIMYMAPATLSYIKVSSVFITGILPKVEIETLPSLCHPSSWWRENTY